MAYNIRTMYYLKQCNTNNNTEYIKQIYVKNKTWNPPPASNEIEDKLTEFEKTLQDAHLLQVSKTSKLKLKNLTASQQQTLLQLKSNKHYTIKPTDKNLGPATLDTSSYIKQVLEEHLLTKDYVQISTAEAKNKIDNLEQIFKMLLHSYRNVLSKPESLYFQRSLQLSHRLPVFTGFQKYIKPQ